MSRQPYKDYYQILGVSRTASDADIRRAFHKLALKYHPDRNAGSLQAEEKFKEINEAYQVLSDSVKRADFDHVYRAPGSTGSAPHPTPQNTRPYTEPVSPSRPTAATPAYRRQEPIAVQRPANIQIHRDASGVVLERTWRSSSSIIGLPTMIFVAALSLILFFPELGERTPAAFIGVLFWLGLLGTSIYLVAAFVLNKTRVVVNSLNLQVEHGPLPLGPDLSLPIRSLRMVFHDRAIFYYGKDNSAATLLHGVSVVTDSLDERRLLIGLSRDEAAFITQELERFFQVKTF